MRKISDLIHQAEYYARKRARSDSVYVKNIVARGDVIEPETFVQNGDDDEVFYRNYDVLSAYPDLRVVRMLCKHTPVLDESAQEGLRRGLVLITKRKIKFENGLRHAADFQAYCDAEMNWVLNVCKYTHDLAQPIPTFHCLSCLHPAAPFVWQRNDEDGGTQHMYFALRRYCLRCHRAPYMSYFNSEVDSLDQVRNQLLKRNQKIL